jgi:hypothetical protein
MGLEEGIAGYSVGHSGGFPGINSTLRMYLDSGFTIAVLSNYDNAVSLVRSRLEELIVAMDS